MKKTPRTDAVQKANAGLSWGSIVVVPEGYPPHDPWALARELEGDLYVLKGQLENCIAHLEGVSRRSPCEQKKHEGCLAAANNALYLAGCK